MILEIKTYGDPVLRKESEEVKEINEDILKLINDMAETMYDAPGVGLAAPQIGVNKRIFVIDTDGVLKKVINPVFLENSNETEDEEEGCLSVPGIYKKVKRPKKVKLKYLNEKGEEVIEEAEGLYARALQHENDHLNGVMFVDKISNISKKLTAKKLEKLKKETIEKMNLKKKG